jgi:hypothetical protein
MNTSYEYKPTVKEAIVKFFIVFVVTSGLIAIISWLCGLVIIPGIISALLCQIYFLCRDLKNARDWKKT